jgi:hypothetical protein
MYLLVGSKTLKRKGEWKGILLLDLCFEKEAVNTGAELNWSGQGRAGQASPPNRRIILV